MIVLDYRDPRPIYEQIVQKFSDLILAGALAADEQMPSVRSLATELAINPNTIQRAYAELERRGYTYSVKGRGSFVSGGGSFRAQRQAEILDALRKTALDASRAGMDKSVLLEAIDSVYGKNRGQKGGN